MQTLDEISKKIEKAQQILITTHLAPDGDALGSSLALHLLLQKMGKKSQVVVPDKVPQFLHFLPNISQILIYDQAEELCQKIAAESDLIFCLDYNTLDRIGNFGFFLTDKKNKSYVMVDHHLNPKDFGQFYFGDAKRASTCELLFELLEKINLLSFMDVQIARCLYTGILTDTGCFRFPATNSATHKIISELLKFNIQQEEIYQKIYENNTEEKLRLWGYATYKKLKIIKKYGVGIIDLNKEELRKFNTQEGYLEGLANYILTLKNIKIGILLSEKEGKIKISFRSQGSFPVNQLAEHFFSGGGHHNAAGGIYKDSMENTLNFLTETALPYYADQFEKI